MLQLKGNVSLSEVRYEDGNTIVSEIALIYLMTIQV